MPGGAREYQLAAEAAAERVVVLLAARRQTLALAESCTGGRVASAVTAVPGASDIFPGAVVCYANAAKEALLGVRPSTLARHGAVSEECVRELAAGARRALGADWGAAITGIAGPGGGAVGKPVGLVHFAWAAPEGAVTSSRQLFAGTRAEVQWQAACFSLGGLEALIG